MTWRFKEKKRKKILNIVRKKKEDRRGESMNANEAGRRIIGVITLILQWLNIRKWDLFGGTCVKPQ